MFLNVTDRRTVAIPYTINTDQISVIYRLPNERHNYTLLFSDGQLKLEVNEKDLKRILAAVSCP